MAPDNQSSTIDRVAKAAHKRMPFIPRKSGKAKPKKPTGSRLNKDGSPDQRQFNRFKPRGATVSGAAPEPESETLRERVAAYIPTPSRIADYFTSGTPLGQSEQTSLRESLYRAMRKIWEYADDFLSATNRRGAKAHIFTLHDEEDTYIVVDAILRMGARHVATAQAVRGIVRAYTDWEVGLVLGPDFVAVYQFYAANGGFGFPVQGANPVYWSNNG